MKAKRILTVMFTCLWMVVCSSPATAAFDSGSTGADGALNPTASTELQLPESGVFNFTTVNIPSEVTVTFKKNSANTPIYILATGDVTIAGQIRVDGTAGQALAPGKGGPDGFDGGLGASVNSCGGTGLGPAGGKAAIKGSATTMTYGAGGGGGGFGANGSKGATQDANSASGGDGGGTYGHATNFLLVGGSGGGGACASNNYIGSSGGGGGGAILIASSGTINVTGSITVNGGKGGSVSEGNWSTNGGGGGGGSGGAIRLMANTIKGEGTISANGGSGGNSRQCYWWGCDGGPVTGGAGGAGRIRLEANTLLRSTNTSPTYSFGYPVSVFPMNIPTLKITRIGGIALSTNPTGAYSSPDVVLPSTTNPVDVVVEAANIPVGTLVTITAIPELGSPMISTATLEGNDSSSTATLQVTLSKINVNVLIATATFTLQVASNEMPIYADGEKVVKMRVASVLGGKSSITYITESGKEIPAYL